MTRGVRGLLADATVQLAAAGVGSPRVDAELLLAHVLGVSRPSLITFDSVSTEDVEIFATALARRTGREPLQHILGTAPFRHLELAVGPGVFIPRPETELLIDAILPVLGPHHLVIDLCAGSGALGLAVLDECPGVRAVAVEKDAAALEWLRRNASGTSLEIVEADVTDPNLLGDYHGRADVVLSNPPYVPQTTDVAPEVTADPPQAVFAGVDGLTLLPAVIARAAELLRVDGVFAVEHDDSHGEAILALLDDDGRWADPVVHSDLAGRPRFTTARRADAAPPAS